MPLTQAEQLLVELINRARLDPLAEAARFDLADINRGQVVTITSDAKQVLAPNAALRIAAQGHSNWMLDADIFSHTGEDNSTATQRMVAAGYTLTPPWSTGENISWTGTTAPTLNLDTAIVAQHRSLFLSDGHRANILNESFREIGVGQVLGAFTWASNGVTYTASMVTENFAFTGTGTFLTGVAFQDIDNDRFFDSGEGRSDVEFRIGTNAVLTAAAGGYALAHTGTNAVVEVEAAGQTTTVEVDFTRGNVKLDVILGGDGAGQSLWSSQSTRILGGAITEIGLLGVGNLSLWGDDRANVLHGGSGNNSLWGEGGDDVIFGGRGNDMVRGGTGNDVLRGDDGNDTLAGNAGDDDLSGGDGNDTVYGGAGNDMLRGGSGNDDMNGDIGNDTLAGNDGRDMMRGGTGNDVLFGGAGNDTLAGNDGNDTLRGGGGNDRLIGGAGTDLMFGEAGADVFVFSAVNQSPHGNARSVIGDFTPGEDRIDLSAIMPGLIWIGNGAYSGTAGEVRFAQFSVTRLYIDTDGNSVSDFSIDLTGAPVLTAGDVIL